MRTTVPQKWSLPRTTHLNTNQSIAQNKSPKSPAKPNTWTRIFTLRNFQLGIRNIHTLQSPLHGTLPKLHSTTKKLNPYLNHPNISFTNNSIIISLTTKKNDNIIDTYANPSLEHNFIKLFSLFFWVNFSPYTLIHNKFYLKYIYLWEYISKKW